MRPDLSVIIINWNTRQLLLDCIRSVIATVRTATFEIFVVDNGSSDGSVEAVQRDFPDVAVIANGHNLGFAAANNRALARAAGTYAVLLNSDTILKDGALDGMFRFMEEHPGAGMCGPQLLYGDGSKQTSTGVFPEVWAELAGRSISRLFRKEPPVQTVFSGPTIVDFIIGACMFVRRTAVDKAGMLDEGYFFFYEEIDWCHRMGKAGLAVYHLPEVEIFHFGGQSTKNLNLRARVESWRSRYLFFRKSLGLRLPGTAALVLLGLTQTSVRFTGYTILNLLSLFCAPRLRRRWTLFAYLMLWHLRGMPLSMGLTRT